jgi:hypothetical protein
MDSDTDFGADRRRRAYQVGGRTTRERIAREAPLDHQALENVRSSDIVVVRGTYDHVEWVLAALGLPFVELEPHQLREIELRPQQLLVINCPGNVGPVDRVRRFVEAGGSLFTTDWALRHVLESAFPGVVAFNDRPTGDSVVRVEVGEHDNPFLKGVVEPGDDPLWWLEGSSYPIRVLDPGRVKVLISSRELEANWGEAAVAVTFPSGEGEVFHMVSHYYLQRTQTRTRRHRAPAAAYAAEKGVVWDSATASSARDLSLGEVESAASSARLFANVIGAHKRRHMEAEAERRREGRENREARTSGAGSGSVAPGRDGSGKEDG